jgi:hypothetical protein
MCTFKLTLTANAMREEGRNPKQKHTAVKFYLQKIAFQSGAIERER